MPWERLATIDLPLSGPEIEQPAGIAEGAYTEVTEIVAPSSAAAGSTVSVTIRIKNLWTASVHVAAVGIYDTEKRFIDWLKYWIPAGATHSFSGSFVMPNKKVTIHAYSIYWGADGYWHIDDEKTKDVSLAVAWQKLTAKAVTIIPEVVAWQKLTTKAVTITPIAWQKLATKTITLTPVAWQKLAEAKITVTPIVWQKLATKAVTITPEEIPPGFELLEETIYPYAYVYDGSHDGGTITFRSDPFTPASWIVGKLAARVEDEVKKSGGRMLEMRVYVDKSPLFWTDWIIETVTVPPTSPGVAVAIGIAWWAVAILIVLGIILIIVITYAVKEIAGLFTHKALSEEIKATWSRETLISVIGDFEEKLIAEEKLPGPPTPPEELEKMSDEELRDYTNELAKMVVPPPKPIPWELLAILAILGAGGVAVAYVMSKPEELEERP